MLQAIRDKAQGWIAWAIVAFISVPFALWGIQEYLGVGDDTIVAQVNGQEITERALEDNARRFREQLRANLGGAYRAELFSEQLVRQQALDQMINEQVMRQAAQDWGMRASDAMVVSNIQGDDAFQENGRFSPELYRIILRNNGLSEAAYEASVRDDLALRQFQLGVAGSTFATRLEVDRYQRLLRQKRNLVYAVVKADGYLDGIKPDDAATEAFYNRNQARYQVPERVKIDYLMLDAASLAETLSVSEEDLAAYFEEHKDQFVAPEERKLRHILITIEDGDDGAALAKAREMHQRLLGGEDFAALAKEHSADPGSAANGGDLGWVSTGIMVEPFENAAFALADQAISEPVKSPFGYHLIQVQGVRGGGEATLDLVHDQVSTAYRRGEVERDFFEQAERLAELAYENPDNLTAAADSLGLKIQTSDWLTANGGVGELASPKIAAAAFSEDVLQDGNNSELIELGPEKMLVLRVVEHQESRARALDEVRDEVVRALSLELATEQARVAGEAAVERLKGGAALADIAAEMQLKLVDSGAVRRDQTDVPVEVRDLLFAMQRPAEGQTGFGGVELASGDYALAALSEVQDGDVAQLDSVGREMLGTRLTSQQGVMEFAAMIQALREQADVSITLRQEADDE